MQKYEKDIGYRMSGAGKSTFASKLAAKTGLPLYYLDMIWHKPDKTCATVTEFDMRLNEILSTDGWIIDGNYLRTLLIRPAQCDTVLYSVITNGRLQYCGIRLS